MLSFEVTAAVGQRRGAAAGGDVAPLPADDVADEEVGAAARRREQASAGGAGLVGGASQPIPRRGDDDAVVRFSFNVGADGKLEGAFRTSRTRWSGPSRTPTSRRPSRRSHRLGAETTGAAGRVVVAVAAPRAVRPSRAHRFRAAVRAYEWSEARRLALTVEEAAYVARSMARKDALDRALWSGDMREAARHAEPPPSRAIGAYAVRPGGRPHEQVSYGRRARAMAALATAAATPLATSAAPAAAAPARTASAGGAVAAVVAVAAVAAGGGHRTGGDARGGGRRRAGSGRRRPRGDAAAGAGARGSARASMRTS